MTTKQPVKRSVIVAKDLPLKEGRRRVINKVLQTFGGDYRGVTYDPKTGVGTAI